MVPSPLSAPLKWLISLGALFILFAVLAGIYVVHLVVKAQRTGEAGRDQVPREQRLVNRVIELGPGLAKSHGIEEEVGREVTWQERVPVYGRVVPNPRATVEVRSPFAGVVHDTPGNSWPAPGEWIDAAKKKTLGWVDIRVGPQERLDLKNKLNEAEIRQRRAAEIVETRQKGLDSLKKLPMVEALARKDLDDALVQLAEAQIQLDTAAAAVELWKEALAEIDRHDKDKGKRWSQPLKIPAGGEITELPVRPGMVVEAGALVARLVDFRRALVRLDIPPEILSAGAPPDVNLFALTAAPPPHPSLSPAGGEGRVRGGATNQPEAIGPAPPMKAHLVGAAPSVDPGSQFSSYWYETQPEGQHAQANGGALWRPGLFIKAYLEVPHGRTQKAVSVPASALLYHQGRALVYRSVGPGRYERREVQVLGRDGDRLVLAAREPFSLIGLDPGKDSVVYRQAQLLLSEEFLIRIEADNE